MSAIGAHGPPARTSAFPSPGFDGLPRAFPADDGAGPKLARRGRGVEGIEANGAGKPAAQQVRMSRSRRGADGLAEELAAQVRIPGPCPLVPTHRSKSPVMPLDTEEIS